MTESDNIAARLWGESIGRVRFFNDEPIGTAKGTGLRGELRRSFEGGLARGYSAAANSHRAVTCPTK